MVICSKFRMGRRHFRDDGYREHAPHFSNWPRHKIHKGRTQISHWCLSWDVGETILTLSPTSLTCQQIYYIFRYHQISKTSMLHKLCSLFPSNNDYYLSSSIFTDYLLGQGNTTLDYKCIQPVSDSLPVTLSDFDGNTVIQLYNMRSGNG